MRTARMSGQSTKYRDASELSSYYWRYYTILLSTQLLSHDYQYHYHLITNLLLFVQACSQSIIRRHNHIIQHPIREVLLSQNSRMRPWLQTILPSYRLRETRRPLVPRIRFHHVLDGLLVHQLLQDRRSHVVYGHASASYPHVLTSTSPNRVF